ncbi:MAG: DNA recombination protein RmuC, partial [Oleiharenicola lentus]
MDILFIIVGLAVGAALGWFIAQSRSAATAERARLATEQIAKLEAELATLRIRATELEGERAALKEAQPRLTESFKALSADALRSNNQSFLELARESFGKLHQQSSDELGKRQQAIDSLVKPLKESLEKVDAKIGEIEKARANAYGQLSEQLKSLGTAQVSLQAEASKLTTA